MNVAIVKVGGSLALYPAKLRALCLKLSELSQIHRLIMLPGGAEFADVARRLDKRYSVSCEISHRMAILGMDQYGFLLSDLTPKSVITESLEKIPSLLDGGLLPIFLPSKLLFAEDPLENSWDVTSDSIAVYLAGRLQLPCILLVTDVDGIYDKDPKRHPDAKLQKELSAKQLLAMNQRTSVDAYLPKLLSKVNVNCFVVNGLDPDRIAKLLNGEKTTSTKIRASTT